MAGIIAAGDGSRLAAAWPGTPKPLVTVCGVPLCHWIAGGLKKAGAREITVLLNSRGAGVRESLEKAFPDLRWNFLFQDTASSWESFRLVSHSLAGTAEAFVISTVDALMPPSEVARFSREAAGRGSEAALALTDFVDDEKPLWAQLGTAGWIEALGPGAKGARHATCGLYYLTRGLASRMPEAAAHASLREYLISAVGGGARVAGVPLSKTVDVDRPEDLAVAEGLVREMNGIRGPLKFAARGAANPNHPPTGGDSRRRGGRSVPSGGRWFS